MGAARPSTKTTGITLDAGALIALERGDGRMIALLQQIEENEGVFRIPAGVVGQVARDRARQVVLERFLKSKEVQVKSLDLHEARVCGALCGLTGTSDVIDASVVLLARANGDTVVTSDPDDIHRLDGALPIEEI